MSKYPGNIVTTGADAGYSVFFPGSGSSYVVMTNASAAINPTTSTTPFTIECWVYTNGTTTTTLFAALASENYGFTLGFGSSVGTYDSAQTPWFGNFTGGWGGVRSTTAVAFRTWTHIACVFTGSTCFIYQNGVLTASGGPTTWGVTGSSKVRIGCRPDATTDNFNGYIAGARVVIGSNLYPGGTTFTPPTVPLNVTNTQLLVCNSPNIVDQSNNAFPLTISGTAAASTFTPFTGYQAYNPALGAATPGVWSLSDALQAASTRQWNMYDPYFNYTTLKLSGTPVTNVPTWITDASTNNFAITPVADARAANLSPFSLTTFPNSGSGYFDGTGDELNAGSNAAFSFGTGAYTVEGWMYLTAAVSASHQPIFVSNDTTGGFTIYNDVAGVRFQIGARAAGAVLGTNTNLLPNTWYHIVAVRSGTGTNQTSIFLNGSRAANGTDATNWSITGPLKIGGITTTNFYTNGYISNLRVVKGTALYDPSQTTIPVPTAPLTAVTNTSLLTLQNSQSSNNNSFLDSSSNNFLITRNGNTTQGTFTPFSQTGWSNYFDGSSYLANTNAAFAFGTGDFSITFYMYRITGTYAMGTGNTAGSWAFTMSGAFRINNLASDLIACNAPVNQWSKIQVTRVGTTVSLYLNDALQGTATSNQNFTNTGFAIGSYGQTTSFAGTLYVSNLVIVKAGVTVLDTCRNNRFLDNSTNNFTFTVTGAPSVQAFSPFQTNVAYTPALQGGSGYFDGTGDNISVAANAAFQFGTGDFCVEAWIYITNTATAASGRRIYSKYTYTGSDFGWLLSVLRAANQVEFVMWNSSGVSQINLLATPALPGFTWHHIAVSRSGANASLYVNGTRVATSSTVSAANDNFSTAVTIGSQAGADASTVFQGYISSARVVKGSSIYDPTLTTLTVPTAPLTAVSNTSLLCNFTNGGIVDTTAKNALETVGDARISTVQSKYGGSSMFFDGTGDWAIAPASALFNWGTSDFTIECWVYFTTTSSAQMVAGTWAAAVNRGWFIYFDPTLKMTFTYSTTGSNAVDVGFGYTPPTNTWVHIAYVRAGGNLTFYANGAQQGSVNAIGTASIYPNNQPLYIGQRGSDVSTAFNGYIQDFRITRFARYTGTFTPPTSLLQNQ